MLSTTPRLFSLFQLALLTAVLIPLLSCGSNDTAPPPQERGIATPTYHGEIATILYANCVSCHQNNGIASTSFVAEEGGFANAVSRAGSIKLRTQNRSMPPWLADNSGQCKTFEHARWLSDADIDTIGNWVDNDTPEGTAPLEPITYVPPPGLFDPSATATMSGAYNPVIQNNPREDDYRCFVVDPGISGTTDQLLTAFEVQPGNSALVHHIILFDMVTEATEVAAIAKDNADPTRLGYSCFGGSGISKNAAENIVEPSFIAAWAPGTKLTTYPEGTGIKLVADRKMIMQIHYNLANLAEVADTTDLTQVKLKYTATGGATQEALIFALADSVLDIPPGINDYVESTSVTLQQLPPVPLGNLQFRIWGAFPHMHTYGKSIDASITRNGIESCLIDIPQWDFGWQQFFFYDQNAPATTITANDTITLNCHYDTSGRAATEPNITWGDGTKDEMCLSFFYVTF